MSTSELAEIETLLLKVLPDPMGFAERLLGELAERLATAPAPASAAPSVIQTVQMPADEDLSDRCILLAAALGACDCWGEDPDCAECEGAGTTGWVPPDPELYEQYVTPAVRRVADEPTTEGSDEGGNR